MSGIRRYSLAVVSLGTWLLFMSLSLSGFAAVLCKHCRQTMSEPDNRKVVCVTESCPKKGIQYSKDAYITITSASVTPSAAVVNPEKVTEGLVYPPSLLSIRMTPV